MIGTLSGFIFQDVIAAIGCLLRRYWLSYKLRESIKVSVVIHPVFTLKRAIL